MSYVDEVTADSPFAWWRLGDAGATVEEESNTYDGSYTGSTLAQTGALAADADTAVLFDGTDDYASVTTLGTFGSSLLASTAEFWIKTTTTALDTVLGTVNTGTSTFYEVVLNASGDTLTTGTTTFTLRGGTGLRRETMTADIYDGEWHHVVWVVVSNVDWLVYVDGTSVSLTVQASGSPTTPANFEFPLTLGARNLRSVIDRFGAMTLDEVALYTSALSEARVDAHYTAGITTAPPPSLYVVQSGLRLA